MIVDVGAKEVNAWRSAGLYVKIVRVWVESERCWRNKVLVGGPQWRSSK